MKEKFIISIEVISILLSFVFGFLWLKNPNGAYEPPFAVVGFFFVLCEFLRRNSKKKSVNLKDKELFEQFEDLLSNNDYIRFYKEHDFIASFDRGYWLPLMEIVEVWDNAAHQFIDEEMERARKRMYKASYDLGTTIAKNTVPNRYGKISVIADEYNGLSIPDQFKEEAKEINALVPAFVEEHDKFIRLGHKKLY